MYLINKLNLFSSGLMLLISFKCFLSIPDICRKRITLSEDWRHYSNEVSQHLLSSAEKRCDINMQPKKWYSFLYGGKPAMIVSEPIEKNHCGTEYPIVIFENHKLPRYTKPSELQQPLPVTVYPSSPSPPSTPTSFTSSTEQVSSYLACVPVKAMGIVSCPEHTGIKIQVADCGQGSYDYYFNKTVKYCPSAFCIKEVKENIDASWKVDIDKDEDQIFYTSVTSHIELDMNQLKSKEKKGVVTIELENNKSGTTDRKNKTDMLYENLVLILSSKINDMYWSSLVQISQLVDFLNRNNLSLYPKFQPFELPQTRDSNSFDRYTTFNRTELTSGINRINFKEFLLDISNIILKNYDELKSTELKSDSNRINLNDFLLDILKNYEELKTANNYRNENLHILNIILKNYDELKSTELTSDNNRINFNGFLLDILKNYEELKTANNYRNENLLNKRKVTNETVASSSINDGLENLNIDDLREISESIILEYIIRAFNYTRPIIDLEDGRKDIRFISENLNYTIEKIINPVVEFTFSNDLDSDRIENMKKIFANITSRSLLNENSLTEIANFFNYEKLFERFLDKNFSNIMKETSKKSDIENDTQKLASQIINEYLISVFSDIIGRRDNSKILKNRTADIHLNLTMLFKNITILASKLNNNNNNNLKQKVFNTKFFENYFLEFYKSTLEQYLYNQTHPQLSDNNYTLLLLIINFFLESIKNTTPTLIETKNQNVNQNEKTSVNQSRVNNKYKRHITAKKNNETDIQLLLLDNNTKDKLKEENLNLFIEPILSEESDKVIINQNLNQNEKTLVNQSRVNNKYKRHITAKKNNETDIQLLLLYNDTKDKLKDEHLNLFIKQILSEESGKVIIDDFLTKNREPIPNRNKLSTYSFEDEILYNKNVSDADFRFVNLDPVINSNIIRISLFVERKGIIMPQNDLEAAIKELIEVEELNKKMELTPLRVYRGFPASIANKSDTIIIQSENLISMWIANVLICLSLFLIFTLLYIFIAISNWKYSLVSSVQQQPTQQPLLAKPTEQLIDFPYVYYQDEFVSRSKSPRKKANFLLHSRKSGGKSGNKKNGGKLSGKKSLRPPPPILMLNDNNGWIVPMADFKKNGKRIGRKSYDEVKSL